MNILIIGGSGYIGSHVADELTQRGHNVRIFDKEKSNYLKPEQEMIVGNILDKQTIINAAQDCDIIYNFAAIANIDECSERPVDTAKYNILGNTIALEVAKELNIDKFIYGSSVYVYSNYGSFYRTSKQASELFVEDYHEKYGLTYTIIRYGSLYGGRAQEWNGVHRVLEQALKKGKIVHHGDGEEKREYIHIKDAASLSAEVINHKYDNEHVILTGKESMRMKDFYDMIKEILNIDLEIEYKNSSIENHYKITPYSFNPTLGKKVVKNCHIDMGQGILNYLQKLYKQFEKNKFEKIEIINEKQE